MRIFKCWFCSSPVYPGHGMTFVRNDSKEFRFCRAKCHKAFKKKKNPRKTRWTKACRKALNKELGDNSVYAFEKKKNTLLKYDREVMNKTMEAIGKINTIRQRRENTFVMKRLKRGTELRKLDDIRTVENQMHLIRAPHAKVTKMNGMEFVEEDVTEEPIESMEIETELETTEKELEKSRTKQLVQSKPAASRKKKILAKQ